MKIVLAVSNKKNQTVLYITDGGQALSSVEMLRRAANKEIDGVHIVTRQGKSYLRVNRKIALYGIDEVTLAARKIVFNPTDSKTLLREKSLRQYWNFYQKQLAAEVQKGEMVLAIEEKSTPLATKAYVAGKLRSVSEYIFEAAQQFRIDPYLLGAIILDEVVRFAPFEEIKDALFAEYTNMNVSVGIAQVTLDNARSLITKGYFSPMLPGQPPLIVKNVHDVRNKELYKYVINEKNNVFFAAALLASYRDVWKRDTGIALTDAILATLYHLEHRTPHDDPQANERGLQIVDEFYSLAKEVLG